MALVVLCLAAVLAPWTTATPVHSPTALNITGGYITGGYINRTKRSYCQTYDVAYNNWAWPWCGISYYDPCYDPCYPYHTWPTSPSQTTVWPTARPTVPTSWPTYWPTYPPTTRPPYTIWPTRTPLPTRPPSTVWPTQTPRPTRPPYTPIMPTRPARPTRPPYTPIMPTRPARPTFPPVTDAYMKRGGSEASQDSCPAPVLPCTAEVDESTQSECKLDYQCPDGHGCCYDYCLHEYKCRRLVPDGVSSRSASYYQDDYQDDYQNGYQDDYRNGYQDDHQNGYQDEYQNGYQDDYQNGYQDDHQNGYQDVYQNGYQDDYQNGYQDYEYYEDATRVERTLQDGRKPAVPEATIAANDTKQMPTLPEKSRQQDKAVPVAVIVDEWQPDSDQHLQHQLQLLTGLPHSNLPVLFLPLHPPVGGRRAVWEVVQCAAQAATEQQAAIDLVGCVVAAPPQPYPGLESLLSSVKQCGRDHLVTWTSLQRCVKHGKGRIMLRSVLLRHGRLLQAVRKYQLTATKPSGVVFAVNGNLVEGTAADLAAAAPAL